VTERTLKTVKSTDDEEETDTVADEQELFIQVFFKENVGTRYKPVGTRFL